ncbi:hypothetical protein HK414_16485 [Ramlibacter terrae]|uniref:RapA2 cadherin-like domain-containing protein n=1 Tax=Ramlibacter terrae TaxID=2732511 RepID=A0ABX6P3N2_9BURK|nr:hypothetical protein HK414_16485 [Ramlibacter terrae]
MFRAWDRTTGAHGQIGDTTAHGPSSAYSTATAEARITIAPVNDAPVQPAAPLADLTVVEGGSASLGLAGLSFAVGGSGYEAGQALTYTVTAVPAAAFGNVLLEDGTVVAAGNSYTLAQLRACASRPAPA